MFALLAMPMGAAPNLRAGVQAVDVTPQRVPIRVSGSFLSRTAHRIDGRLFARSLVLESRGERIVLTVVDSLMMPREMLDRVKLAASGRTGVPVERMMISATHTHSAPPVMGALGTDAEPEYAAFLEAKIVESIERAARNLIPARVGWAAVDVPEHTHCRRWILRPDKVKEDPFGLRTVRANMHPGYQNPEFLGPSGPVDPQLTVLAVRSRKGQPVALLANYSMHYVGVAGGVISPDYYGPFVQRVEEALGGGAGAFVAMMSQGTSGDLHWMDYRRPKKDMSPSAYADALAAEALRAYRRIRYSDSVRLAMAERKLGLRRRVPDEQRVRWANEILAGVPAGQPRTQVEVYAREQLLIRNEPERYVTLQAIRIGDLGIAAFPAEVFALTGLKVKRQSPLPRTFNIELANGAEGYIPPPEQHELGGYTTWPARTAGLEPEAEPKIVAAMLELLEQVAGKPRRPLRDRPDAYSRAVLGARPLAYWRMNEMGGAEAADASRHGRTAVYRGGVAFYLDGAGGGNRAPQFAGGCMRAEAGELGESYSIAMWFRNALPLGLRAVTGYLCANGNADFLGLDGTGRLFAGAGEEKFSGASVVPVGTWTHVVLTRDGEEMAVYLNGGERPEIFGRLARRGGGPLVIGCRQDSESTFEGKIDEVAVFGRRLRPAEIRRIHRAARVHYPRHVRDDRVAGVN